MRDLFSWLALAGALIFYSSSGQSAEQAIDLSFGPSLNGSTNPKYFATGYELQFETTSLLAECGGIFSDPINGVCMGVFSARVETTSGMFTRIGFGPAYAFRTDDRLSSHFEFSLQGALGFTADGWAVGAKYQHFSNAGIVPPNMGRDFILGYIEIGI